MGSGHPLRRPQLAGWRTEIQTLITAKEELKRATTLLANICTREIPRVELEVLPEPNAGCKCCFLMLFPCVHIRSMSGNSFPTSEGLAPFTSMITKQVIPIKPGIERNRGQCNVMSTRASIA